MKCKCYFTIELYILYLPPKIEIIKQMKNLFLILLFLLAAQLTRAQNDTIVYYKEHLSLTSMYGADRKVVVQKKNKNLSIMTTSSFKDGKWNIIRTHKIKLKKSGQYKVSDGKRRFIRSFSKIKGGFRVQDSSRFRLEKWEGLSRSLFPLSCVGKWTFFYQGKPISINIYKKEKLVESYFTINDKRYPTNSYANADSLSSYKGGMEKYIPDLAKKTIYPKSCQDSYITGKVLVLFCVNADGKLGDFQILTETDQRLNQAAVLAVVACNNWSPAIKDGKPIKIYNIIPINFKLKNN